MATKNPKKQRKENIDHVVISYEIVKTRKNSKAIVGVIDFWFAENSEMKQRLINNPNFKVVN
jgi:regulatory protein YycH of two-component signal transduction system YycFG